MSFYLSTLPDNSTSEHCSFATYTSTATAWELEFRVINPATADFYVIGNDSFADNVRTKPESAKDTAIVRLNATDYAFTWANKIAYDGEFHIYRFVSAAGVISAFRDEVEAEQTRAASVALTNLDRFFRRSGTYSPGGLSWLKITENGTLVHHWDAPSSNGTGSTLPDIVGTKDATLVNFTTDDSQWVSDPTMAASLTVTPADLPLVPGGTISGTYANYATIPTTLTVSDGTNTITIPTPTITNTVAGDGTNEGTYSGTMPALPTTGTANLVLFGDVTVELS